jgi:predicted nucleic acid-binding Zn ribbon protein
MTIDDEDESDDAEIDKDVCPRCGEAVYEDAVRCPRCGAYISEEEARARKPIWIIIGVIVCLAAMLWWVL